MTAFKQLPLTVRIARRFGAAASHYEEEALAQRQSEQALLDGVTLAGTVLDIGCGTGWLSARLAERDAVSHVISLDIAAPMLASERLKHPKINRLLADGSAIPLASASLDGLVSNFALQWLDDPRHFSCEVVRLLRPGGHFRLAIPVLGTLQELQDAWRSLGLEAPVNRFPAADDWRVALTAAGLQIVTRRESAICQYYPDLRSLLHALKAIGASELRQSEHSGIRGPAQLRALEKAISVFRTGLGVPLRYQVLMIEGIRP